MDTSPIELFSLTFDERPGYLYAYVAGEHDSYEISKQYWRAINDECTRIGAARVLIEENIVENATMADAFQLMSELPRMGFGRLQIAFVDRYIEQNDLNKFGELVAVNRGMNARIFSDVVEAEQWLLSP
jgi:hypothetical protein